MKIPCRLILLMAACASSAPVSADPIAAHPQHVDSEASRTLAVHKPHRWRAEGFPRRAVAAQRYVEMPVARILQLQDYNATSQVKAIQVGIGRRAANESVQRQLPALRWLATADGGQVSRLQVTSPDAMGLRVGLHVRLLHPRAELRFAGSIGAAPIVATVSGREVVDNLDGRGMYWTPATDGDAQTIEIYLPSGISHRSVAVQAPEVSHLLTSSDEGYKIVPKIGESGSCNVDTACRVPALGPAFVSAKNAVAHMLYNLYNTNGTVHGSFICTGTLLADTDAATQIPFFYTAHHCFQGGSGSVPLQTDLQRVATSLNTYWKYEATSCGSGVQGPTTVLTSGADFLYSSGTTDAMLLKLRNPAPAGSHFAGWDFGPLQAGSRLFGIHHPSGDAKKVSEGEHLGQGSSRHTVGWVSGTTEGGSSGSAIFSVHGNGYRLRGGLFGGSASCANTGSLANIDNRDYYSRFDVVFPNIRMYLAAVSPAPVHANGSQPLVRSGSLATPPAPASAAPKPAPARRPGLSRPAQPGPFEP